MTEFLKNKSLFVVGLIIGLVLPAFLLPFYHFHPGNSHTHPGQLKVHDHPAHFHSEVLETYAHLINLHPSNPEEDKRFHQTHSSADHDRDDFESLTFQRIIPPTKTNFVLKTFAVSIPTETPQLLFLHPVVFDVSKFTSLNLLGPPSSRSPPISLI